MYPGHFMHILHTFMRASHIAFTYSRDTRHSDRQGNGKGFLVSNPAHWETHKHKMDCLVPLAVVPSSLDTEIIELLWLFVCVSSSRETRRLLERLVYVSSQEFPVSVMQVASWYLLRHLHAKNDQELMDVSMHSAAGTIYIRHGQLAVTSDFPVVSNLPMSFTG